jgi:hypothetical protein
MLRSVVICDGVGNSVESPWIQSQTVWYCCAMSSFALVLYLYRFELLCNGVVNSVDSPWIHPQTQVRVRYCCGVFASKEWRVALLTL